MKKNVGTLDATFRIALGLAGLAWSTSRLTHRPYRLTPMFVALLSGMKVAEGITRYCPLLHLFHIRTNGQHCCGIQEEEHKMPHNIANYPRRNPISPETSE